MNASRLLFACCAALLLAAPAEAGRKHVKLQKPFQANPCFPGEQWSHGANADYCAPVAGRCSAGRDKVRMGDHDECESGPTVGKRPASCRGPEIYKRRWKADPGSYYCAVSARSTCATGRFIRRNDRGERECAEPAAFGIVPGTDPANP
jgi:hypothetical protein